MRVWPHLSVWTKRIDKESLLQLRFAVARMSHLHRGGTRFCQGGGEMMSLLLSPVLACSHR